MKTLQEISNTFHVAFNENERHVDEVRAQLDQLEQAALRYQRLAAQKMGEKNKLSQKLNAEHGVYWTECLLRPLLVEIEERTGWLFDNKDDLRTFGLRAECPVFIMGDGFNEYGLPRVNASITFTIRIIHEDGELWRFELYYDTGEYVESYPAGSIGAMNGFGNKTVKVESVEQVIEFLRKQMEE